MDLSQNYNFTGNLQKGGNDLLTAATTFGNATGSDAAVSGTYNALDMQLGAGVVGTTELADGAVTSAKIANDAVTSAKIANGTIVPADLDLSQNYNFTGNLQKGGNDLLTAATTFGNATGSDAAVSGTYNALDMQLGAGVVGTTELADGAVTSAKIANGTVVPADMDLSQNYNFTGNLQQGGKDVLTTGNVWTLSGNALTGSEFIGSTNSQPVTIRVNNSQVIGFNTNSSLQRDNGGNTRGQHAVDLQIVRAANTQVASGHVSTVGGGRGNTASGSYSTIGGGDANTASGSYSTIGGGTYNTASGYVSTVGGGEGNTASGSRSTVGGGQENTASAYASTVSGGYANTASAQYSTVVGGYRAVANKYGQNAYASGRFATDGDAQTSVFVARRQTGAAGWTTLYLDASTQGLTIPNNATWTFRIIIVGKQSGGTTNGAGYKIEGVVTNNGGTASFIGTPTVTTIAESNASYNARVTVSGANLVVQVEGAGNALRWVARIETAEVTW